MEYHPVTIIPENLKPPYILYHNPIEKPRLTKNIKDSAIREQIERISILSNPTPQPLIDSEVSLRLLFASISILIFLRSGNTFTENSKLHWILLALQL